MKKLYFFIIIIQVILFLNMIIPQNIVYAEDGFFSDIIKSGDEFLEAGGNNVNVDSAKDSITSVYNVFLIIGIVIAVVIGGILGIQFMIASAEDKAKIKEALIPYVVGCIVVFGAFEIWKAVVNVLDV